MPFKLDFSQVNTNDGIQDGTYEAVFFMMNEDANPNTGNEFIRLDLIVRNDVEQKYQNAHIFDRMYKSRATGNYSMKRLSWMGKAAKLDEKKEYNDLEDLCNDFIGRPVKVTIKNSDEKYNGKVYHHVNITRWEETSYPIVNHQWKKTPEKLTNNLNSIPQQTTGTGFMNQGTETMTNENIPF